MTALIDILGDAGMPHAIQLCKKCIYGRGEAQEPASVTDFTNDDIGIQLKVLNQH